MLLLNAQNVFTALAAAVGLIMFIGFPVIAGFILAGAVSYMNPADPEKKDPWSSGACVVVAILLLWFWWANIGGPIIETIMQHQ